MGEVRNALTQPIADARYEQFKQQHVTVAKSGGDFTTIQGAIDSIVDATANKRYIVKVYPGRYNENIVMSEYIDLQGAGSPNDVVIWANTGTVMSFLDGDSDVRNVTLLSTPTAPGARLVLVNAAGNHEAEHCILSMNPTGTYATAVDISVGAFFAESCRFYYTQTGLGGGNHILISTAQFGGAGGKHITVEMTVAAVTASDDAYLYRSASDVAGNGHLFEMDATLELSGVNPAQEAYGFYHVGASDEIQFLNSRVEIKATGGGATGDGYVVYLDSSSNNVTVRGTGNKASCTGFANNYFLYVGTGDTFVSHFASVNAVDGMTGPGDYFYANSPADREFQAKKIFAVGGAGTFTLTNYGLIAGEANSGAIIQNTAQGSFAAGFAERTTGGTPRITGSEDGGFAQGAVVANNAAPYVSEIIASGKGGFAQGYVISDNTSTRNSLITSSSEGTFAQGAALQDGVIEALEAGSFAQGYAFGGTISSGDDTAAYIKGSKPQGGTFAQGAAQAGERIAAKVQGAFAQGFAYSTGVVGGSIRSVYYGSFAQGFAFQEDIVSGYYYGGGSIAQGFAGAAPIQAYGFGAFAQGASYYGTVPILASGYGSFAQGYAGYYGITSSGTGSFAQGSAGTGAIVASNTNSVQFGIGNNAQPDSLQVGLAGLRLRGTVSATPPGVQNGDIWVRASGDVVIRSGGASVVIA